MDIRKVKKLIELLDESGVAEIEIKEGEEAVRISRYNNCSPAQYATPSVQHYAIPNANSNMNHNVQQNNADTSNISHQ